ncbi:MAG: PKD domain-containing protein, partial [Bacteroidia bacterium]
KLYVDGALEATYAESLSTGTSDLQIGGGSWYFTGKMDEIRIYSRALSSSEIVALYDAEKVTDLELTKVTFAKDTICSDSFYTAKAYLKNVSKSSVTNPRITFIIKNQKKLTRNYIYSGTIKPDSSISFNVKLNLYDTGITSVTAYYIDVLDSNKSNDTFKTEIVVLNTNAQFEVENNCIGQETVFKNKTSFTSLDSIEYTWKFGDGTSSNDTNPVHIFTKVGTYKVILLAKSKYGCTDSVSYNVDISPLPEANFSVNSNNICLGAISSFSDSSVGTADWYWDFGDSSSSFLQNPVHQYKSAGTYLVTLTVMNIYGCTSTLTDSVTVNEVPEAIFSVGKICVGDSFTIKNKSKGATQYLWKFGDDSESFSENPTHKYLTGGDYKIHLLITNNSGCTDFYIHPVFVDSTCVWPGDANADKIVDNNDILAIGLAFGDTGSSRTDTSISWKGNIVKDWSNSFTSGENYKHADSDGDGEVGNSDTLAVGINYSNTHDKNSKANRGKNTDPVLKFDIRNDSLKAGDTLVAYILLGENALPAKDVYGLAFTVNYNADLFSSSEVDFSDCWLGNNLITFNHTSNKSDFAITRTDHLNTSGSGKIAVLKLVVKQDIPREINKVLFEITDNTIISADGETVPVNVENDSVPLIKTPNSINIIDVDVAGIKVYPNPGNGVYNIAYTDGFAGDMDIIVYTINGKKILTENSNDKSCIIDLTKYPGGIYLLQIQTQNAQHTVRLIKN